MCCICFLRYPLGPSPLALPGGSGAAWAPEYLRPPKVRRDAPECLLWGPLPARGRLSRRVSAGSGAGAMARVPGGARATLCGCLWWHSCPRGSRVHASIPGKDTCLRACGGLGERRCEEGSVWWGLEDGWSCYTTLLSNTIVLWDALDSASIHKNKSLNFEI